MEDREIELLQDDDSKAVRDLRRQLVEVKQSYNDMYDQFLAVMSLRDNLVEQLKEKDAEIEQLRSVLDELDPTGLRRIK